jgi:hypothetical protein
MEEPMEVMMVAPLAAMALLLAAQEITEPLLLEHPVREMQEGGEMEIMAAAAVARGALEGLEWLPLRGGTAEQG